jgi:hypothetical protein
MIIIYRARRKKIQRIAFGCNFLIYIYIFYWNILAMTLARVLTQVSTTFMPAHRDSANCVSASSIYPSRICLLFVLFCFCLCGVVCHEIGSLLPLTEDHAARLGYWLPRGALPTNQECLLRQKARA